VFSPRNPDDVPSWKGACWLGTRPQRPVNNTQEASILDCRDASGNARTSDGETDVVVPTIHVIIRRTDGVLTPIDKPSHKRGGQAEFRLLSPSARANAVFECISDRAYPCWVVTQGVWIKGPRKLVGLPHSRRYNGLRVEETSTDVRTCHAGGDDNAPCQKAKLSSGINGGGWGVLDERHLICAPFLPNRVPVHPSPQFRAVVSAAVTVVTNGSLVLRIRGTHVDKIWVVHGGRKTAKGPRQGHFVLRRRQCGDSRANDVANRRGTAVGNAALPQSADGCSTGLCEDVSSPSRLPARISVGACGTVR